MPDFDRNQSLEPADALDRYWDAILADTSAAPEEDLDPSLAAAAQRVQALDAAPSPHPAFASTLWEDLTSARSLPPAFAAQPSSPLRIRSMQLPGRWRAPKLPRPMSRLAAAILLIVLLAGSAFAALYPLRVWDSEGLPLFAPLATPTAKPALADESVLLDLTLTDIPPYRAEGGMGFTTYPPGGSSREKAATSTEILYIATGPMTVRVEEAPEPLRVIPPAADQVAPETSLLEAGEETTLETGTTLVAPPGTILNLGNEGSAPATMLDLLWATASNSTEAGGAIWNKVGGKRLNLVLPISIVLRQATLGAEETLQAPDSDDMAQTALAVDADRRLDIRSFTSGNVRNASNEPMDVYLLTVTSNAHEATPAAAATSPGAAGVLEFLWESEGGPDPIVHPYGVGIDPLGNVWVSDGKNDRFQIFAPDGTFLETWGASGSEEGQLDFFPKHGVPTYDYGDVAFDADGNIYVADTGNFRVQKFAPDRSFLLAWGGEGREDGEMLAPGGIAAGADGTIYVVDEGRSDVQMFKADGTLLGAFGESGGDEGQFTSPAGVAVDGDGDVWVADFGNNRMQRFSSSGGFLASWGSFGADNGELYNPNDVAIDESGRVFVADLNNNRLQVFAPDGRFLAEIGGFGSDPGQFFTPNGLAVDEAGVVYVSDNERVQAFRFLLPNGESPMP